MGGSILLHSPLLFGKARREKCVDRVFFILFFFFFFAKSEEEISEIRRRRLCIQTPERTVSVWSMCAVIPKSGHL